MSTLYALVVSCVVYRDLTLAKLKHAAVEAGISTGVVLLIIMASSVVGWIVTYEQLPAAFTQYAKETLQSPWLIILAMNLIMLATGSSSTCRPPCCCSRPCSCRWLPPWAWTPSSWGS